MRTVIGIMCLNALCVAPGHGAGAVPVEPGSIHVDGVPDEAAWEAVPVYELRHALGGEEPTVATRFRLATDGDALIVAVECEQPDMETLRAERTTRDADIWSDDCVEVFLDPTGRGIEYFQFIVNANGACYDSRYTGGGQGDPGWDLPGLETAGARHEDGWSVELRLPFAGFVMPSDPALQAGDVTAASWRFNVTRQYKGGAPGLLTFQPLNNFFDTAGYAPLEGLEGVDFGPFRWRLGPLGIAEVRPQAEGGYVADLTIPVENLTGRLAAFSLNAVVEAPGEAPVEREIIRVYAADAGQTQQLPLAVPVRESGRVQVDLALSDPRDGRVLAAAVLETEVDVSPLRVAVTRPFYRASIYATMEVSEVELEVSVLWPPELTGDDRLMLRILDDGGEPVAARTVAETGEFWGRHALPIPRLAPGTYRCEAALVRDEAVRHTAHTPLHVHPPSVSEVRVNEHLNVVINGRETFLVGFFHNPWALPIGEWCNAAITYSLPVDLEQNPERGEYLSSLGAQGRWLMMFPHPRDLWTHQVGGRPELARRPLPPQDAARFGAMVAQYRRQPGLLGWYMCDEPNPATHHPSYMRQLADTLREHDPYHPAYISFNNGSTVAAYDEAVDMLGVHWYCMFRDTGPEHPLATIADHMQRARNGVGDRKAIIYSPQLIMYAHGGVRRPVTHRESRCMAYLGIVHGARGIIWFATTGLKSSAEIRIGIPFLIRELRAMEPVFLAHERPQVAVGGPGEADIHAAARVVDGRLHVIVVNASPEHAEGVLTLPEGWQDETQLRRITDHREPLPVADGRVALDLEGYEVWLLTTDPDAPALPADSEIHALFEARHQEMLATGNLCYLGAGATLRVSGDYGPLGAARLAVDGYLDRSREAVRNARRGSWLEVHFAAPAEVARIEVSSDAEAPGRLEDYQLHLLSGDQLDPLEGVVTEREEEGVLTRVHRFPAAQARAVRITLNRDMPQGGMLNEIQAFGPEE